MHSRLTIAAIVLGLSLSVGSTAYSSGGYGGGFAGGCSGYGGLAGGCGGYDWAYGVGIGGLYNGLDRYSDYRVPYFAAHPPVYYSHPVPRPYGYSPFSYPPHVLTPEVCEPAAPLTINNPYVPSSESPASESKTDDETVSVPAANAPLMVVNPYVVESKLASAGR